MSILLTIFAAAAAAPAVPTASVQIIAENDVYVMRTLDGSRPLYTFDKDEPGKSNCVDRCLAAWPALTASAGAKPVGKWSVITRPDGSSQWAYESKPVYTFVRDSEGVATGDGMGGAWHLLPTTPAD
jgi:predicted lipoprotein with Yx(FWY)xxD motif